ncbi:ATP-binding protein [Shouchella lehensis]|uniref:ATP-binding protein n=1 Tax=Shouchella lehensis TaxID=300825 RepID=A0A4Y7WIX4_9BACI|nr:ATP-binding protein [Shouchella lehensis]TES48055.1 ATP-binding protein [Shouchella lehensis]
MIQATARAISQVMEQNTTNFPSKDGGAECPHCGEFIPQMKVDILNRTKIVQPVCECVTRKMKEEEIKRERFVQDKTTKRLFNISTMGEKFASSTFESFIHRSGTEKPFKAAQKYVNEFEEFGGTSLGIWGSYGNGKSHIAAAVANELNSKGHTVVFQTTKDMLDKLKSTFGDKSNFKYDEVIRALVTCDLLVLDDIGAEKVTEWVEETFFGIIDHRYRKKRPIFYTSNLKPSELHEKIGGRSVDRLSEMCITIENKATSYRKELAKERLINFAKDLEA